MANDEHLEIFMRGIEIWNEWREQNTLVVPDLSDVDLHGIDLARTYRNEKPIAVNLSDVNLARSDLSGSNLLGADLVRANLQNANLSASRLRWANLSAANLTDADLSWSELTMANFTGACLYKADLRWANLPITNLTNADLSFANLIGAQLVETEISGTNLTGCRVYGVSAWKLRTNQETKQSDLIISDMLHRDVKITVDNLEVAQFIFLLTDNNKIRDILKTITTKTVLILGRFSRERKLVLDAIRYELRRFDYIPVLFDFEKPITRDTHEVVATLARMARFVIADITSPKSIPQELTSIVETMPSLPIQPILKLGNRPWGMYDHIKRYPWVLDIYQYRNIASLLRHLPEEVIIPAEAKARELQGV